MKYSKDLMAQETMYKGVKYASKAEARTAQALDLLGIEFIPHGGPIIDPSFDHNQYTPDFKLPELGIVIEVAGVWDARHAHNAYAYMNYPYHVYETLYNREGHADDGKTTLVVIDGNGFICDLLDNGSIEKPQDNIDCVTQLGVCSDCGRAYFLDTLGSWGCPYCGRGGDSLWFHQNICDAAGVKRYGRP